VELTSEESVVQTPADDHAIVNVDPLLLREQLVDEASRCFARCDIDAGVGALEKLQFATIDEETLQRTDRFLPQIVAGKVVVATCDPRRKPSDGEVVVIYGNYPHFFENVVVNNPIKRHVATFGDLQYDKVEYDDRWELVKQIYIINADDRPDRYDSILRELAAAKAPLQRVKRISAIRDQSTGVPQVDGQLGALRSHIEALKMATAGKFDHVLILEDDFCFTSDLDEHMNDLRAFLAEGREYTVCLLATSKYGKILPRDDLISVSVQPCTNAAAYLVSGAHLPEVLTVQERALTLLRKTGDTLRYADDRYWTVLQASGQFFVFRKKFGFQAASFSDIERQICRYLD